METVPTAIALARFSGLSKITDNILALQQSLCRNPHVKQSSTACLFKDPLIQFDRYILIMIKTMFMSMYYFISTITLQDCSNFHDYTIDSWRIVGSSLFLSKLHC